VITPPDNTAGITSTSGIADWVISAADGQHRDMRNVLTDGQTDVPYKALRKDGSSHFETGRGTWRSGTSTLERTTVKTSASGDGVKHSFPAGEILVLVVADKQTLDDLGSAGSGDMLAATYDPGGVAADAFSMGNMAETAGAKVLSGAERTKLGGVEAGATADQTGPEIASLYEAEADRNQFTDAEKSKLSGIEAGATADQSGAEIAAAYEGEADRNQYSDAEKSKLAGVEVGATADCRQPEFRQPPAGWRRAQLASVTRRLRGTPGPTSA